MIARISIIIFFLLSCQLANAEEWVYSGPKTAKSKPSSKFGGPAAIKIDAKNSLMFKSSVAGEKLSISLSDGKQKFGKPEILISNGENIYMRPRLRILVPLAQAKQVTAGKPFLVTAFSHLGNEYEITLVHNSASKIPDTVVTKK